MHPFHERLARVGLAAAARYGFCLAGGYAERSVMELGVDWRAHPPVAMLRAVRRFPHSAFEPYAMSEPDIDLLRRRLLDWAGEISGRPA